MTKSLTPAAKRDLLAIAQSVRVDICYGPFSQLIEHGYIEGTQDDYRITESGQSAAQQITKR